MASIQKRVSRDGRVSYRALVRVTGYPMRSATFGKRSDALKWSQEKEVEFRLNKQCSFTAKNEKRTLSELIDQYLSQVLPEKKDIARQTIQLNWWKTQIGTYKLCNISSAVISECRTQLQKGNTHYGTPRSAATINRYLAAISHVYTVAWKEWNWIDHNPVLNIRRFKEPRGRVRCLDDQERQRLLDACKESRNPFLHTIVMLALSTGMRRGEILGLRWRDLDLCNNRIIIQDTKNGERRAVPLVCSALQLVKELRANGSCSVDDFIFHSPEDVTKRGSIRTAWEKAIERAKIENFRFHDLRHSTASYLAMNGASLLEIAEILGHKTLQMVKRYSHLSEGHTTAVLEKMNKKVFG
jgi:integrase